MTIFWPSTHPSSRSPCRNAASRDGLSEGDVTPRKPIRGTFPACCCACAASGHATAPPRSVMNSRRLMCSLQTEGHTLPPFIGTVLCITAFWPTRLPLWVKNAPKHIIRVQSALPQCADIRRPDRQVSYLHKYGLMQRSKTMCAVVRLPDHLVGGHEQLVGHCEPERFRGFDVKHCFVLGRRLHREIGRL